MPLDPEFVAELRRHFTGDIRNDDASRVLYSTDASIYQIEPLGIVVPRTQEDLQAAVELAAKYRMPILPRGSGTSLAGQAIGRALILDCSRWLDGLIELDAEARTATVEPGLILSHLNQAAAKFGLQYGPDPASAERATLGGVIANNATGAHSISYGMTADHILSADVLLADGSAAVLQEEPLDSKLSKDDSLISRFRAAALDIRSRDSALIRAHYPGSWRNSAGYRLNYLLPWSPTRPAQWTDGTYPASRRGTWNLAPLLAGSEGTLAIIRRAKVRLVEKPQFAVLVILAYDNPAAACDAVPDLLTCSPSAIELIPRTILNLARTVPAYAAQMGWVREDPAALLVVEFSGDLLRPLIERAHRLGRDALIITAAEEQARVWAIRRAGLGILDARPQSARPAAFIEDCAIPVEHLGEFVRQVESLLAEYHTEGGVYAHASAGCLHIRPVLDLKTTQGVRSLRAIAERVLALTLRLGGAMSSEHGDGLVRGEWLTATYGEQLIESMRSLKRAADPNGLLNPGKLFDAPPMDTQLRYGEAYRAHPWAPTLDFSENGGLATAIEQCNGQGVCRKDTGVMCPSFQATRQEMHSTRGRANLLRSLITSGTVAGQPGSWDLLSEQAAFEALDLCLACKGCKAECPSGVDMAKLKFEFMSRYYEHHRRSLRDYVFGYFHVTARLLSAAAPLVNAGARIPLIRQTLAHVLRITPRRPFPRFARGPRVAAAGPRAKRVLFLRDPFTHFVEPEIEQAAFDVLRAAGYSVEPLDTVGAGAALLSKGFIKPAVAHSRKVADEVRRRDPRGALPVVAIEPSELYTLRHDYVDLLADRGAELAALSSRSWSTEELLLRSGLPDAMRIATLHKKIFYHPHCHQRAESPAADLGPIGGDATLELLRRCGYEVELSDAGCCGMAGTFGYEAEHYELSQQVGALRLFPRVRQLKDAQVAASGAACRMQITQATGAPARHPLLFAAEALNPSTV